MAQTAVGLYVSTEHVDLVQISGRFQNPRIDTFGRVELPKGVLWREAIQETVPLEKTPPVSEEAPKEAESEAEKALIASLRTLIQRTRPTTSYVSTAIPPEAVVIRYFQLPWLPLKERSNAILFEATKYLPYRYEELNRDFQVNYLVRMDKGPTAPMRVVLFALRKVLLASYLRVLKAVGLIPTAIEVVPLSLLRLLRQGHRSQPDASHLLVFIDRDTANITIAGEQALFLSRNLTLLPQQGGAPSQDFLEALLNEARVSVDYYRRRFSWEPGVNRVILVGYQIDRKMSDLFTNALNIPVELLEPLKGIPGTEGAPPGFATAVGLALRGLDPTRGQVNLLPVEERPILQSLMKPAAIEVGVALLLLGALYGSTAQVLNSLERKGSFLQQMAMGVHTSSEIKGMTVTELMATREKRASEARFLQSLQKGQVDAVGLLTQVASILPDESWLSHLLLEKGSLATPQKTMSQSVTLRLSGKMYLGEQGKEVEEINRLINALRANSFVTSHLPSVSLENVKRSQFHEVPLTEFLISCHSSAPSGRKGTEGSP